MLHGAVVFLVIALVAAVFGFGGIAASAAGIANILFVAFVILAFPLSAFELVSHVGKSPQWKSQFTFCSPSSNSTCFSRSNWAK